MKRRAYLMTAIAPFALIAPAAAQDRVDTPEAAAEPEAREAPKKQIFNTGVARGRDILDSAISTSTIEGDEIVAFSPRSLAEVLRNIPGVRAEVSGGEGNNNYSIRGLPLAATGSKWVQFQEDGLPVLEFADIQLFGSDMFMRVDANLAAIEAIRGGSASTFASNSPGGVINLISKTGKVEGGQVLATVGLDYDTQRVDFDYGGRISDTLRFQIGGFYRDGEGPRDQGYNAYHGGQLKLNITKELGKGYIRIYGKYLDDHAPSYQTVPMMVTGSDSDPSYHSVEGFDLRTDSLQSRNVNNAFALDQDNNPTSFDLRGGMHPVVKSIGLEAKFDIGKWNLSEKFRYSGITGGIVQDFPLSFAPASALAQMFGGPGATLRYANGPMAGQAIANPSTLNGNGLLSYTGMLVSDINSLDNMTNDLRISRVWNVGNGKLTTTAGYYHSRQAIDVFFAFTSALQDIAGDGNSALIDVVAANGTVVTEGGFTAFSLVGGKYQRRSNVDYTINAPYGSLNYHIGKLALGASIRYDMGEAQGTVFGEFLGGGRNGVTAVDFNRDGVISRAESQTGMLPLGQPGLVDYNYDYVSYSVSANYRVSEPFSVFARYSRGGRAAADRILFTPAVNYVDGSLNDPNSAYDTVKQTEVGMKFRRSNYALNVTGFLADTGESNLQVISKPDGTVTLDRIVRGYRAYGAELEGSVQMGQFSVTAGATYTNAEITSDLTNPAFEGNTPRHQSDLIFQVTPRFDTERFSIGGNVVGSTSSYAQDSNQLKLPAYALVNAFAQVRPMERVSLTLNVNNLFDATAITEVTQPSIPASGIVVGRAVNGRTISASLGFSF